ncbi:hypothetical protein LCGC14_3012060, partial [marine sediment metagenome]
MSEAVGSGSAFLGFNLDDIPEQEVVDTGEYLLSISADPKVEPTKDGTGQNIIFNLLIKQHRSGEEPTGDLRSVRHWVNLPKESDVESTKNFKLRMLKRFCDAFGITYGATGVQLEGTAGLQGWAILEKVTVD